MGKAVTYVAELGGERFTRTSRTRAYTHVTLARFPATDTRPEQVVDARWSMSAQAAAKPLPNGWEKYRVAVVPCVPEQPAGAPERPAPVPAPAAATPAGRPVTVKLDLTAPGSGVALVTGGHGFAQGPQALIGRATQWRWYAECDGGRDHERYYGTDRTAKGAVRRWLVSLGLDPQAVAIEVDREY